MYIEICPVPENSIEPVKEPSEKPTALLLWPQQQRGQCRTKRESVKGREDYGNGDGQSELLVKPSGDAWDKGRGYKDRRKNHRNTDHGTGELFHGPSRRILGSQSFLDVA